MFRAEGCPLASLFYENVSYMNKSLPLRTSQIYLTTSFTWLGDTSPSSAEQKPDDTGDNLSILSPMEHLGDKGVFASPMELRGDWGVFDSPTEDLGETFTNNCDNLECADLLDWRDVGLDDAAEDDPELILSAVNARVIFFLGLGWLCLDFSLLASVAMNAFASSFLVDG